MGLFESIFGKKIADQITPESDKRYNAFLNQSLVELKARNQLAMDDHGLGMFDEWSLNQDEGILRFLDEQGNIRIETPVVILGTYSSQTATWMWGWANRSLVPGLTAATCAVRDYGESNSMEDFTQSKIECDEGEAWAFAAAAWKLLGGSGVYRGPSGALGGRLYISSHEGYHFLSSREMIEATDQPRGERGTRGNRWGSMPESPFAHFNHHRRPGGVGSA
ncbi:hypothetical protein SAMN02745166_03098 [Prosthecobacter debontii]|uniref:Uncharacterized protein n=1 Tax=Prosthecobacter debontii TaxID=48467 RepID=A0A1T4YEV1_9BACT|nr:DUF6882 domain-containing protein [Prosthecobacter debontii]SKB00220.1 hypothetical protein SAMN02745166_03098 [Prosthecobacter debontii]